MTEKSIDTKHSTLNALNIIPMLGGVPLIWAVSLVGLSFFAAILGFSIFGSILGLMFVLPFAVIFVIVRFVCSNGSSFIMLFELRLRCTISQKLGKPFNIMRPPLHLSNEELLSQIKKELIKCGNQN